MDVSSTGYPTPITVSRFYDYDPVLGLLIAASVIFSIQTAILTYQSIRSRTLFLVWLVVFTACEAGGYIAFSVFVNTPALNSYLAELILIILAPNFVTLVNYVVISRIIPQAQFGANSLLARRGHLVLAFFLASDLLCLTIQSIGGSQLAQSSSNGVRDEDKYNLGKNLNLAGISAQLAFQTVFAVLALYVYVRMPAKALKRELRWAWLCMLLTMVMVSMRNIYRIAEFASGQHSAINATSAPYFVLDLLLMVLTGAVFIVLDLGSDWVLPADIRSGKMVMDNTAAVAAHSGAAAQAVEVGKGKPDVVVEMHNSHNMHDTHNPHAAHTSTSETSAELSV